MRDYYFISDSGNLHDTRRSDYPLRSDYMRHHRTIGNARELCATLRAGEFCFPGGYRLAFITDDGECLSFKAVRENMFSVVHSMHHEINDGWRIVGCEIVDHCETPIYCAHTGELLNGDKP